jgi:membrane protease subunit (stomatin/prohibitin family)
MGLFDKIRGEFVDIIEWQDSSNDTLIWRFPRYQNEIKMGAKLTVRESQAAVFMNEGKIADVFAPGMYTLQTHNMPVLTTLKGWAYGFNSPFKVDVYFASTRQITDQKWGTKSPIIVDDQRFGMIELRAFGTYAFQVVDPGLFVKEIAGTDSHFVAEEINGQLRSLIVTKFTDAVGEGNLPVEKFAANLEELSELGLNRLNQDFQAYGLKITRFLVENVSMPEELKKEIFEYSRLNKIDMAKLTQFKAAKSIETAAGTPNSTMGMGVGMGMGFGMGNVMTNTFGQMMGQNGQVQSPQAPPPVPPPLPTVTWYVAVNGQQNGPFTFEQLSQQVLQGMLKRETLVWKQGMASWVKADGVAELSELFANLPPPLPPM